MAKLFRMYVGHLYINYQIGVNIIGLPEFITHELIISKQIKEVNLHKYE